MPWQQHRVRVEAVGSGHGRHAGPGVCRDRRQGVARLQRRRSPDELPVLVVVAPATPAASPPSPSPSPAVLIDEGARRSTLRTCRDTVDPDCRNLRGDQQRRPATSWASDESPLAAASCWTLSPSVAATEDSDSPAVTTCANAAEAADGAASIVAAREREDRVANAWLQFAARKRPDCESPATDGSQCKTFVQASGGRDQRTVRAA